MKHLTAFVVTMAVGAIFACSDDDGGSTPTNTAGTGGGSGAGGAGAGAGGVAGTAGRSGSGGGGAGGTAPVVPPDPALPPNAPTVACPTVINGAIETTDDSQTGRHNRNPIAASTCETPKSYPGNAADPTNAHFFDVYRFSNPSAATACFEFTLTYDGAIEVGDAGSAPDASADAAVEDGGAAPVPDDRLYMTAYGTFYPTDLELDFLGDVGGTLVPPQGMSITVPAGETIDVVVYGVDPAPGGLGAYRLSCATQ